MIRVGKVTAGLVLLASGGALLADRLWDTNYLGYAFDAWPLVFILLGLEYLWVNFRNRRGEQSTRIDFGGVLFSVIIAAAIALYSQHGWPPSQWFQGFSWNFGSVLSGEFGHKFEKEQVLVPVSDRTEKIEIENPNGSVVLKSADTDTIRIETTIWVDKLNEEAARLIADGSKLTVTDGPTVRIAAEGQAYSGNRKPRMNLVVTVPANRQVDMDLQLRNGKVQAEKLPIRSELVIRTTNGSVQVADIGAKLIADTTNGSIHVSGIRGMADLGTTNGAVTASDISEAAVVRTSNSAVTLERIGGKAEVTTTNGSVTVDEPGRDVRIKTTNGAISVSSRTLGGDWDLNTTNGRIELLVPGQGNFEVDGRGGKASSNLPLTVSDKTIRGKVGSAQHKIRLDTSNGTIVVNRVD